MQCGISPFDEGYASLRPYLEYVHVKDALSGSDRVVPAGEGDGQLPETLSALRAWLRWLLLAGTAPGIRGNVLGFSGPELFRKAAGAFKELLRRQDIEWA